jgi:hypothetical protein
MRFHQGFSYSTITNKSCDYGSGNDLAAEVPMLFCNRTVTEPWTVPEIENGRCNVLRLPKTESLLNHALKSDRTSKVIEDPEAEQPETEPQLSVTTGFVLNVKISPVTSRDVERRWIRTANPF